MHCAVEGCLGEEEDCPQGEEEVYLKGKDHREWQQWERSSDIIVNYLQESVMD